MLSTPWHHPTLCQAATSEAVRRTTCGCTHTGKDGCLGHSPLSCVLLMPYTAVLLSGAGNHQPGKPPGRGRREVHLAVPVTTVIFQPHHQPNPSHNQPNKPLAGLLVGVRVAFFFVTYLLQECSAQAKPAPEGMRPSVPSPRPQPIVHHLTPLHSGTFPVLPPPQTQPISRPPPHHYAAEHSRVHSVAAPGSLTSFRNTAYRFCQPSSLPWGHAALSPSPPCSAQISG